MRDNYLETNTYPFGEFTGQIEGDLSLPLGEAVQVTAVGDFKIHGVERPISVSGQLKRLSDKVIELEAFLTSSYLNSILKFLNLFLRTS